MPEKLCFISFATPCFFGPYGNQLYKLMEWFSNNSSYELYYLLMYQGLTKTEYTYEEFYSIVIPYDPESKRVVSKDDPVLKKVRFLGGFSKHQDCFVLMSGLNKILGDYGIQKAMVLSDVDAFIEDEPTVCTHFACWYPNHFRPLRPETRICLSMFTHIVSLCKSDEKLLKEMFPDKKVNTIAHIVDIPKVFPDVKNIREQYKIPKDAFVVMLNCGNYDTQNRKSLDTSLLAYDAFQKDHPDAFLVVHAWHFKEISQSSQLIRNVFPIQYFVDNYTNIPKQRMLLNETLKTHDEVMNLMYASDVLLHGSKTEGFGIPIVEAQLMGIPVISTKFGAMEDYTKYGYSVDYAQPSYEPSSRGMWVIPSIENMREALCKVYRKECLKNKNDAIRYLVEKTSRLSVGCSFYDLFDERISYRVPILTRIRYRCSDNKFEIFNSNRIHCEYVVDTIQLFHIKGKWVVFHDEEHDFDYRFTSFLYHTDKETIILSDHTNTHCPYPTTEQVLGGNFDMKKVYYVTLSKKIKPFFMYESLPISNSEVRSFCFSHAAKSGEIAICSDKIIIPSKHI